jgi:starvation-inducible DNA-binding protein
MMSESVILNRHASPSALSVEVRVAVEGALQACLVDGLDLHSQLKVAHWNLKGPHFAALHPLLDTFAAELAGHSDTIAERIVTLGGTACGTVRQAAHGSSLPEYPKDVVRDIDHVRLVSERFRVYLDGARDAREECERLGDVDSADLLTIVITAFEKHAWFLLASLER